MGRRSNRGIPKLRKPVTKLRKLETEEASKIITRGTGLLKVSNRMEG